MAWPARRATLALVFDGPALDSAPMQRGETMMEWTPLILIGLALALALLAGALIKAR